SAPKLLREFGQGEPAKWWMMISYPDANTYLQAQQLEEDPTFLEASKAYASLPAEAPLFNRYTSQLLHAFTGMPEVAFPEVEAGLFELRTYEGYNEDAVRRKAAMFNDVEIDLFHRTGLHPVFFGKMLAGPVRPALVYMLHFKDMAERDANWKTFFAHPEWKAMLQNPKFANTVSNIHKTFLVP
ncbi:MAG: NIPSNAP family protein, partial [Bacteroidota bacterium]